MSNSAILKSSLAKKYWMALTGLFLCSFLIVHLIGNLQLLKDDGGQAFNEYAKFMTTFPLIKITSYILYASILFHAVDGIMLVIQNRKARPVKYAYNKPSANSGFASRWMGLLGSLVLVFIVTHMSMYWLEMKLGAVPQVVYDGVAHDDLYTLVVKSYTEGVWDAPGVVWVAFYVFAQIVLGFHLWHGFASAFQSLGVNHSRYTPIIKVSGKAFAVLMAIGFSILPIMVYVCQGAN